MHPISARRRVMHEVPVTISNDHNDRLALGITGIRYIEIYVADCDEAVRRYGMSFGLRPTGRLRSSGGDRHSVMLERGEIRLMLTAPLSEASDIAKHLRAHGEGIKDIALCVDDPASVVRRAVGRGAKRLPCVEFGTASCARLATCGDLVHTLFAMSGADAASAFEPWGQDREVPNTELEAIDHVALAVPRGELDQWTEFYTAALSFRETHQENVSTEYSGMRSRVVENANGAVRFPIMEPASGKRQSQIDSYLLSHRGAGAQHLAFRSRDIVKSVAEMGATVDFLSAPHAYYDALPQRLDNLPCDIERLQRYGILVDRDATGVLLQIFSKPIGGRPTLFAEVVERRGALGFGSGNIRALYEAVERAQLTGGDPVGSVS